MIKIKFLRKIIFIGEVDGCTIYFDTKNNLPLKAEKSKFLNTEKSKNDLKYLVPLFFGIVLIGKVIYNFFNKYLSSSENISITAIFSIISGIFICLFLTFLINYILYKNVKYVQPATKHEFRQAIISNNIWNNFKDKKVTNGKKVVAWILTLLFVILSIADIVLFLKAIEFENKIEIIKYGLLGGFGTFIVFLLIFINNPIRWLNVVEKYQKRKLWRK